MAEVEINPVQKPQFVTGATSTNPIRITTAAAHQIPDGALASVCRVSGNVCANFTSFQAAFVDATHYDMTGIDGSDPGCGTYTSGGVSTPSRETIHEVYGGGSNGQIGQGPWVYNGLLHTLISDSGDAIAGIAGLHVMRRNAGGDWVKLDPSSPYIGPGSNGVSRSSAGVFRRGSKIWIIRFDHSGAAENMDSLSTSFWAPQYFDLSTGLWNPLENSGTLPRSESYSYGIPPNGSTEKVRDISELLVRSDDSMIFVHPHFRDLCADGRRYARAWYQRRSPGGTWDDPPIRVFGAAAEQISYSCRDIVLDSDDRVHMFGLRSVTTHGWTGSRVEGEIVYRNLDSSNVLSAQVAIADEVFGSDRVSPIGAPYIYTDNSGIERIVVPFVRGLKTGSFVFVDSLRVLRGDAGASPTWSIEEISGSSPALPGGSNLPGGNRDEMHTIASFAYDSINDTLHCFWQTDPGQVTGDNPSEIYRSSNSGSGWSAPQVWKTGNGLTSNWGNASSADVDDPEQPIWYGFPVPVQNGTDIEVVFGKFAQWQVEDCIQPMSFASVSRTHEFPHIDQLSLCPPAGSGRNRYSYYFQTR